LKEFLHMGGYAGFVWTAYGLTTLILVANWWAARRKEAVELIDARRRVRFQKESRQ